LVLNGNAQRVAAAKVAARARWGPPRIVRLDELTGDQRRVVVAMLEAAKKAAPADANAGAASEREGHGNGAPIA
jgi:hypothetical protein